MLDPELHSTALTGLHRTTIESETVGKDFFTLVEHDVEPVIKELSTFLITPDETLTTLDACILRFDSIMARMASAKDSLKANVLKVHKLGDDLVHRS
jgi:hypothetical protein